MNYNTLATNEIINKTVEGLSSKSIEAIVAENGDQAFEKIKELIPQGVSVMNGSSVTLEQIGFVDYLKAGNHGWNNLY